MIQHVTRQIPPAELDPCVSFYRLLGFERVEAPAGIEGRAIWLALGPSQLHLMPVAGSTPDSGHIAIVATAYDDLVERLQQNGHEVEPRRPHWGAARAYVRDPAGNLVELMAAPPPGRAAP